MLPVCWCMRSHSFLPYCFGFSMFGILSFFNCKEFSFFLSNSGTFFLSNCIGRNSLSAVLSGSFSLERDVSCGLLDNLYRVRKCLLFSVLRNTFFFIFMRGMLLDFSVAFLYPLRFSCCPLPFIALIWLCHIEF